MLSSLSSVVSRSMMRRSCGVSASMVTHQSLYFVSTLSSNSSRSANLPSFISKHPLLVATVQGSSSSSSTLRNVSLRKSLYHTLAPEPEPQTQLIYRSPSATNCWIISKLASLGTYVTVFGFPLVMTSLIHPLWAAVASISAINLCFATRKCWNYFSKPFVGTIHLLPCNTKVVIQTNNAGSWLHEVVELSEIQPIFTEADSWEPPCTFVVGGRRYEIEAQYFLDESAYNIFHSILANPDSETASLSSSSPSVAHRNSEG
eukprot:TRINITY_DN9705_c0_g1_i1.p1 TRINITY_DN9705_c0_g1~~TRINITY_DN9705_c0_g1_i1.p1  ORF type:complete len:260 (-),score=27.91 TRINITY_DN9705_c0_g1_i1:15-794(-)